MSRRGDQPLRTSARSPPSFVSKTLRRSISAESVRRMNHSRSAWLEESEGAEPSWEAMARTRRFVLCCDRVSTHALSRKTCDLLCAPVSPKPLREHNSLSTRKLCELHPLAITMSSMPCVYVYVYMACMHACMCVCVCVCVCVCARVAHFHSPCAAHSHLAFAVGPRQRIAIQRNQ